MAIEEEHYLNKQFASYYQDNPHVLILPPQFEQREFAFFWFSRQGALRHIGFSDITELVNFSGKEGPAHIFHSAAYYETPDAPQMPLKGWLGADLIFDIDADHLNVPCQAKHDSWWCLECGYREHGRHPEFCPKCENTRFQELNWLCEECLGEAKNEVIKIIEDFLVPDFGISMSEIKIVFSGHRGYHIHCYTPDLHSLGSPERREIVDYVSGIGIDLKYHGFVNEGYGIPKGPDTHSPGWERKIAQGLQNLFKNPDQLDQISGLRKPQKKILKTKAQTILNSLLDEPPRYPTPKGVGRSTWEILGKALIDQVRAIVDEPVTTDIHRLIRLPGSLHGKTGFLVKIIDLAQIDSFDPFRHAQVFEGSETVRVLNAPSFTLGGLEYPPMREIKKELPLSAAMLLLCKGVAELTK